jgi:hypothetical protein
LISFAHRTRCCLSSRVFRLILCVGIVYAGSLVAMRCSQAITRFGWIRVRDAPVAPGEPIQGGPPDSMTASASDLSGYWTFGGMSWALATRECASAQIDSLLAAPLSRQSGVPADSADTRFVIHLIEQFPHHRFAVGSQTTILCEDQGFKIAALTTGSGVAERLLAARLALGADADRWVFYEAYPMAQTKADEARKLSRLPLPRDARSICTRWRDAKSECEVVSVAGDRTKLLRSWINGGWSLESTPTRSADSVVLRHGAKCALVNFYSQPDRSNLLLIIWLNS